MSLSHLSDDQILCIQCMISQGVYDIRVINDTSCCICFNGYAGELANRLLLMGVEDKYKNDILYKYRSICIQGDYACSLHNNNVPHKLLYFDCKSCLKIYMQLLDTMQENYSLCTFDYVDIPQHICNYPDCCVFIDKAIVVEEDKSIDDLKSDIKYLFCNRTKSAANI